MKYIINYGNKVACFPESAIEAAARAGEIELRVLLCLCAAGGSVDIKKLAKQTGCGEDQVKEALSFWRGTGIIELCDGKTVEESVTETVPVTAEKAESEKKDEPKKLKSADELPRYTSDELANILEERQETATLINECQNIMGKVFNVKEINVLMGLLDYLCLDCEYIMMLLSYCVSIGKKTLHYAEKTAFALYDAGITTSSQLAEEFKRRENALSAESKIRKLFGIGERAFTTKEKKFISAWINDMGYSIDIIEKAYEVTADATGKGALPYANSILERWNAAGFKTLEEIEVSYKQNNKTAKNDDGLTDDFFFEAAVKRSLGEK